MAEEDTKVFHYGESVIMAGGDRHLKVLSLRLSGTGRPANGVTWSKATVVSNRHSRRRNCYDGKHRPLLRIDGPVAIAGVPRARQLGLRSCEKMANDMGAGFQGYRRQSRLSATRQVLDSQ